VLHPLEDGAGSSFFHDLGCKYSRRFGGGWSRVARYKASQLRKFQRNSRCEDCVHYTNGCPLWMAILVANEELNTAGLDLFIDIDAPCPMFFASPAPIRPSPPVARLHRNHLRRPGGNQGGSIPI
jgi:hypothetical protein